MEVSALRAERDAIRVELVADSVTGQVEAEHSERDRAAGEEGLPGVEVQGHAAGVDHLAPRGRLSGAEAEE